MTPENTEQFTYINRDKIYINNPKWLLFYTIRKLIETKKKLNFIIQFNWQTSYSDTVNIRISLKQCLQYTKRVFQNERYAL